MCFRCVTPHPNVVLAQYIFEKTSLTFKEYRNQNYCGYHVEEIKFRVQLRPLFWDAPLNFYLICKFNLSIYLLLGSSIAQVYLHKYHQRSQLVWCTQFAKSISLFCRKSCTKDTQCLNSGVVLWVWYICMSLVQLCESDVALCVWCSSVSLV